MFGFDRADEEISELVTAVFDLTCAENEQTVRILSIALVLTSRKFSFRNFKL